MSTESLLINYHCFYIVLVFFVSPIIYGPVFTEFAETVELWL